MSRRGLPTIRKTIKQIAAHTGRTTGARLAISPLVRARLSALCAERGSVWIRVPQLTLAAPRQRLHIATMARRPLLTPMVVGTSILLGGCSSINTWLASSLADRVPQWAGGMPSEAPPRPGTAGYDEYVKKLEGAAVQARPRHGQPPQPIDISSKALY